GPPVLEEEAQVGGEGAQKRQQDAEMKRHAGFIEPSRSTCSTRPMTHSSTSTAPSLTNQRGRKASEAFSSVRKNEKPLLFLNIDGLLSLFGSPSPTRPDGVWLNVDGIVHLISATAAEHLQRLGAAYECVWCRAWEVNRNTHLGRAA